MKLNGELCLCKKCKYDDQNGIMNTCDHPECYHKIIELGIKLEEETKNNPIEFKRLDTYWANQIAKKKQGENCEYFKELNFYKKWLRTLPYYGDHMFAALEAIGITTGIIIVLFGGVFLLAYFL